MNEDVKGKKILLVGGINNSCEIIDRAHEMGLRVGVVDYNRGTHARSIADENFYNDIKDVDGIAKICNEQHYNGVITNFIDFALPYVNRIARGGGLPAVFTEEQIQLSTNKKFFKETCRKHGVLTPHEYKIDWTKDLSRQDIGFPVIVKPVDGSGSKGIRVCRTLSELESAKENSLSNSALLQS